MDQSAANTGFAAVGFNQQFSVSSENAVKALVRYYNAHGGIAGRQIRLVEYTFNNTDASYATSYEAGCTKFVQDNHVDAVISNIVTFSDQYEACLANAHVPDILSEPSTDLQSYTHYPTLVTVGLPTINRAITSVLTGLTKKGLLTTKNKIGVIVQDCAEDQRAYTATFEPLARRLGLTVLRRDVNCYQGFSDAGTFSSQVSQSVLPFQTAGVDRVMFVTSAESGALLVFTQQAHSQGYHPTYMLDSLGVPGVTGSSYASDALPHMIGVGNVPDYDVTREMLASATTTRCRSMFASQGLKPSSKGDDFILDFVCAPFFLLEAGLTRSNGHTEGSSLIAALKSLGTSYLSPVALGGTTFYDATHRDGAQLFSAFAYKTSCSCFVYTTKPAKLA